MFNWAERETLPHPWDGERREDPSDAGFAGARLAGLARWACSASPCPDSGLAEGTRSFALPSALGIGCRSSRCFLSRGAPLCTGYETCQPPFTHLYAPSSVSQTLSLLSRDSAEGTVNSLSVYLAPASRWCLRAARCCIDPGSLSTGMEALEMCQAEDAKDILPQTGKSVRLTSDPPHSTPGIVEDGVPLLAKGDQSGRDEPKCSQTEPPSPPPAC